MEEGPWTLSVNTQCDDGKRSREYIWESHGVTGANRDKKNRKEGQGEYGSEEEGKTTMENSTTIVEKV